MANLSNAIKALDSIRGGKKIRAALGGTPEGEKKAKAYIIKTLFPLLKGITPVKDLENVTREDDSSWFFLVKSPNLTKSEFTKIKGILSKHSSQTQIHPEGFETGEGFYISYSGANPSPDWKSRVKKIDPSADKIAKSIQKETDDFDVSYTGYKEFGECIFLFKFKGANINTFLREHSGPGGGLKGYLDNFFDHLGTIKGIETKGKEIYVNVEF